jgi:hypothetical protein
MTLHVYALLAGSAHDKSHISLWAYFKIFNSYLAGHKTSVPSSFTDLHLRPHLCEAAQLIAGFRTQRNGTAKIPSEGPRFDSNIRYKIV